jgi:hypothetical protein
VYEVSELQTYSVGEEPKLLEKGAVRLGGRRIGFSLAFLKALILRLSLRFRYLLS